MNVFGNGKKFIEYKFSKEEEFEKNIINFHKLLFGPNTIFIDAKKKIDSKSLGGTIPDGFFFDLSDKNDPQFYLVEVELSTHSFFNHIFPQITKFFAFYKNHKMQKSLVEKIFSIINTDDQLKNEIKSQIGNQEIYKFLSDIIENSQNILLIIDGDKKELPEIIDTYSDTWGKMVKNLVIKKYVNGDNEIFTMEPEYEAIDYIPDTTNLDEEEDTGIKYSEEFHLEGVKEKVKLIYNEIKDKTLSINKALIFNPQKYYISIKYNKNIAYLQIRKKKIRLIAMMPEENLNDNIESFKITHLSDSVQKFYNNPCAAIEIDKNENIDEVINVLQILINQEDEKNENS